MNKKIAQRLLIVLVVAMLAFAVFALTACEEGPEGPIGPQGPQGPAATITVNEDGFWVINGTTTQHRAIGEDGQPGADPQMPRIDESTNTWHIGHGADSDTNVPATGQTGLSAFELWQIQQDRPTATLNDFWQWLTTNPLAQNRTVTFDRGFRAPITAPNGTLFWEPSPLTGHVAPHLHSSIWQHRFVRWYTDAALTAPATFPIVLNQSITLYSRWEFVGNEAHFNWTGNRIDAISEAGEQNIAALIAAGLPAILAIPARATSTIAQPEAVDPDPNIGGVRIVDGLTTRSDGGARHQIPVTDIVFESGSNMTSIGRGTFGRSTYLRSVTLPESITSLGEQAFSMSTALESVIFEGSPALTTINNRTFDRATSLRNLVLPSSVTTIGTGTGPNTESFIHTPSLGSITNPFIIPASVTTIANNSFRNWTSSQRIKVEVPTALSHQTRPAGWAVRWFNIADVGGTHTINQAHTTLHDRQELRNQVVSWFQPAYPTPPTPMTTLNINRQFVVGGALTLQRPWVESWPTGHTIASFPDPTSDQYGRFGSDNTAGTDQIYSNLPAANRPASADNNRTFVGWYTQPNGQGTRISFPLTLDAPVVNVYTHWITTTAEATRPSFTFVGTNSQGNINTVIRPVVGSYVETAPDTERVGYDFVGWFTEAVGGTEFAIPFYAPAVDTTIHARWILIPRFTLTFAANGGSETAPVTDIIRNSSVNAPAANPTRDGHLFAGWFDTAEGEGASVVFPIVMTANRTIHARWTEITGPVADEAHFTWDGNMIIGLTEAGNAITGQLVIPRRATEIRGTQTVNNTLASNILSPFIDSQFTSVVWEVGSHMHTIGASAFRNTLVGGLIVIPASVTTIGTHAFQRSPTNAGGAVNAGHPALRNGNEYITIIFEEGSLLNSITSTSFGSGTSPFMVNPMIRRIVFPAGYWQTGGSGWHRGLRADIVFLHNSPGAFANNNFGASHAMTPALTQNIFFPNATTAVTIGTAGNATVNNSFGTFPTWWNEVFPA
jgi:uncharacterized repeat protein (TIGR02543 family)